ncbi:PEP phosphonomutase [Arthroderma uncinatum]|uniref:PEP phosphonomutase n=1 Tax=Arthroderma uncinatum TaxID=74035 RepID=UPI00144A5E8C|nr:PEP phosphonomutase [Arthroderma uncinatum]KAF3483946.1 PEP phosphonomutase [Arthroderma uncinatum]
MASPDERALQLRNLHIPGKPLVFANVYDPCTARIVASNPSSTALATASYAVAEVHGLADPDLDLETNIAAVRRIASVAAKHNKPLSVDMQDGYGSRLEEAIESVIAAGGSGCNLEDQDSETGRLFPHDVAVERVRRAKAAATKAGVPNFVINARTDAVLLNKDLEDAVKRGKAFLEAGATTVFVWGGLSRADVERLSKEFGGMLNVSLLPGGLTVQELADIGIARISVGPRMWKAAMRAVEEESKKLLDAYSAMRAE